MEIIMRFLLLILLLFTGCEEAPMPRQEVLGFTASWCGPCQRDKPLIKALVNRGFRIRQIDIDDQPKMAERFNVQSVPDYIVLKDGRTVFRTSDIARLRTFLNRGQ